MTPIKIALASTAVLTLLTTAMTRIEAQVPFETPSWVPDEETKKQALRRTYELNGVYPELVEKITPPPPINENVKNHLDEQADKTFEERVLVPPPVVHKRQKLMHRSEAKVEKDICAVHGLHKVEEKGRKSWKCRKKE